MTDMKKKSALKKWGVYAIVLLAVLLVGVFMISAISGMGNSTGEEERSRLETAIRRAAVSCYATEGFYPPNLEYLVEEYGVQIDESKFNVFYVVEGSNLMPRIDVIFKKGAN